VFHDIARRWEDPRLDLFADGRPPTVITVDTLAEPRIVSDGGPSWLADLLREGLASFTRAQPPSTSSVFR
jgi:hypothetical protein